MNIQKRQLRERLFRERSFFFVMVIILLLLTGLLIWPFVTSILFAVAMVVILKPLYDRLYSTKLGGENDSRTASITIIVFILIIAIPSILIIGAAITQAAALFQGVDLSEFENSIDTILNELQASIQAGGLVGIQIDPSQFSDSIQNIINSLAGWFGNVVIAVGQSLPAFFTNAMIVLVVMYVMLPRYNRPGRQSVLEIVPFPKEITQLFLDKFNSMIMGMFKGTFVISIVSGAAMGIVLWIAGVPYVMFLTLLSMFLAFIPLVGISLVAWPVGIALILSGSIWQGVFVILAFVLVVANLDTVLRPKLVPKEAYLNPALIILSVFGGLQLMGLIGIFYGPVIMILLITCIDVYTKYMLRSDLELLLSEEDVDLKELGLEPDEDTGQVEPTDFLSKTFKSFVGRFQAKQSAQVDKKYHDETIQNNNVERESNDSSVNSE